MAERFLTCPLCGFEFDAEDTLCQHGCPLHTACNLTRCPMCAYEFPRTPRVVSWLRRVFGGRAARADRAGLAEGVLTVRDLKGGERAEILHLAAEDGSRSNALAVFGLVPGSEVALIQRHPSYVVQIGETTLALDAEVAGSIVVRRLAA